MRVRLLSHTANPEHLVWIAARSCWTREGASKLDPDPQKTRETRQEGSRARTRLDPRAREIHFLDRGNLTRLQSSIGQRFC
ncbi:hypothetical protein AKJ44_02945 [candidate division MSBL1 archaeon SCGC-AAA261F17]|uniref:Uncharacterized protein n=1 Tax=candidate division MSBL1 archaeon SCGC-AAA261F17 TaxID=1698274 RepID=A0A133V3T6_9EURY|nr:hypothetical protein AKJ44_02945 [candidate division MSBL1 archaeon SCGC-AAA261F17]